MNLYEVTFQEQDQIRSTRVEATGPVAAERRFLAEWNGPPVTVLCVVRQSGRPVPED